MLSLLFNCELCYICLFIQKNEFIKGYKDEREKKKKKKKNLKKKKKKKKKF